MVILDKEQVKQMVTKLGPHISLYDTTKEPWPLPGRTDAAIVQRDAEDGESYGCTVLYLAYDAGTGVRVTELYNTNSTHDYLHIMDVRVDKGQFMINIAHGSLKKMILRDLNTYGLK